MWRFFLYFISAGNPRFNVTKIEISITGYGAARTVLQGIRLPLQPEALAGSTEKLRCADEFPIGRVCLFAAAAGAKKRKRVQRRVKFLNVLCMFVSI